VGWGVQPALGHRVTRVGMWGGAWMWVGEMEGGREVGCGWMWVELGGVGYWWEGVGCGCGGVWGYWWEGVARWVG